MRAELIISKAKPVELAEVSSFTIQLSLPIFDPVTVSVISDDHEIAMPLEQNITFNPEDAHMPRIVRLLARNIGETVIRVNRTDPSKTDKSHQVKITVVHSLKIRQINVIIGWVYFVIWSISFYPQVIENYLRKSVIGLNFDFLCYNITGFVVYSIYCSSMYWIGSIQEEYFKKFGGTVIPVAPNDVFFAIHAAILTVITIAQCTVYEKGAQKVSRLAKVLVALMWSFAVVTLIPVALKKFMWVEYVTCFSYIKLLVTLIKYIPQAYMNYRRKSTDGWSIGFVHSDFIGGLLSILQVLFLSYNNNQWSAIMGNFTKFGLASVSIIFDVLFLLQHYVFYKQGKMRSSPTTDIITLHDQVAKVYEKEVKDDE